MTSPIPNDNEFPIFAAAKNNDAGLCAELYGNAPSANIYVNAKALRIAAENKSYEALECMLDIASEALFDTASIGLGPDWNAVQKIGKEDARIQSALENYDRASSKFIDQMLTGAFNDVGIHPEAPEPTPVQKMKNTIKSLFKR